MENGKRIITRSAQTYSDLTLPEEQVEIVSSRSPEEIIRNHFQRLSALKAVKPLPAPTTLDGCLKLVNERRERQQQAMGQKTILRTAVSFFRWRKTRRRRLQREG